MVLFCSAVAQAAPVNTVASPLKVAAYATVLRTINPQLPQWQSKDLASRLLRNASHWKIDPNLLAALVTVESRWHTQARSRVGAIGLGQLMPGTAASLHVNPRNAAQNLSGSARYLSGLLDRFSTKSNRLALACAAYNAGPQAVVRFGGVPPYAETQHYVVRVMRAMRHIERTLRLPLATARNTSPAAPDVSYWSGD
ncbi:MAG: lytic transglycosylase domain-containing protein [Candidatus Eremiobacteraeota bacterium]|nr:lytic transglycosylase domain-containing protein [Candidatus Eremiobacteraeota bacterium]